MIVEEEVEIPGAISYPLIGGEIPRTKMKSCIKLNFAVIGLLVKVLAASECPSLNTMACYGCGQNHFLGQ